MKQVLFIPITLLLLIVGCTKLPVQDILVFEGEMNKEAMKTLKGVVDIYEPILHSYGYNMQSFDSLLDKSAKTSADVNTIIEIALKIQDSLFNLSEKKRFIENLNVHVLPVYQKFIPLSEVENYLSNRYRDIRGFVHYAGDVSFVDICDPFFRDYVNLTYPDSPFDNAEYAGYAVIRFSSLFSPSFAFSADFWDLADPKYKNSSILYFNKGCPPYSPPYVGHGFDKYGTGFELICEYDLFPVLGEIYEVTPRGNEILRGVLTNKGWEPYDGEFISRAVDIRKPLNNMIKNGLCGRYEGNTYPAQLLNPSTLRLISDTLVNGFEQKEINLKNLQYMRDIPLKLADPLLLYTHVVYNGDTLQVRTVDYTNHYHLTTSDSRIATRQGMINIDYGTWRRLVPTSQIDRNDLFDIEEELP